MNLLDIIFPKRCLSCRSFGKYLCGACANKMQFVEYLVCPICQKHAPGGMTHPGCKTRLSPDGLISFFRYNPPIRNYIHAIKYRFLYHAIEELVTRCLFSKNAALLTQGVIINGSKCYIVPIPLHPRRMRERGFNQSELLAHCFGKATGMTVIRDMIIRKIYTIPQVTMKSKKDRVKNMKHAFLFNEKYRSMLSGSSIVVVDDVWTSGATTRSACSVLKRAGCNKVYIVTVAQ